MSLGGRRPQGCRSKMDPPCVEVSLTGKGKVEKARRGRAGHVEGAACLFGRLEDE